MDLKISYYMQNRDKYVQISFSKNDSPVIELFPFCHNSFLKCDCSGARTCDFCIYFHIS